MRCSTSAAAQLHRFFEDVLLENGLSGLIVESLPLARERSPRELERAQALWRATRYAFFLAHPDDDLHRLSFDPAEFMSAPVLLKTGAQAAARERFVIFAETRFCALLAGVSNQQEEGGTEEEVIWSFEPDIVYSALEYLAARVAAEFPSHAAAFAEAVRTSISTTTSMQLAVSVTTKLAFLLQEQAAREKAIGRISAAVRGSLDLNQVLLTAAEEVGRTLGARYGAVRLAEGPANQTMTSFYFRAGPESAADRAHAEQDLAYCFERFAGQTRPAVFQERRLLDAGPEKSSLIAAPLSHQERFVGVLLARADDAARIWREDDLLLLGAVAEQVAVAINHARLFAQSQEQGLTDGATGCFNRRFFDVQLERDISLAVRSNRPVSLAIIGVASPTAEDPNEAAVRAVADVLRKELRIGDTVARYSDKEFALIMPQTNFRGAVVAAERFRSHIERAASAGTNPINISFGIATFPLHASSIDALVTVAARALDNARRSGHRGIYIQPEPAPGGSHEQYNLDEIQTGGN